MVLYYITDRSRFPGGEPEKRRQLLDRIAAGAAAGVDYIQLREKDLSIRELERLAAEAVRRIPRDSPTRFLVNARLDVALACGAHGVHLPANDLPASEARALFSRLRVGNQTKTPAIVAVSAHTVEEVLYAEAHGADFAVFGPVFEKDKRAADSGLERLRHACDARQRGAHPMPVLALGGVTEGNAHLCREAGAAGIAGIRLFQDHNVETTVKRLREICSGA